MPIFYPPDSSVTLNPNNTVTGGPLGSDAIFVSSQIKEQILLSSPLIYARIVDRRLDLNQGTVMFNGTDERTYLNNAGVIDDLYDEGDKKFISNDVRVYGSYEIPIWAQELGKLGMMESEELTLNFHIDNLNSTLDGSLLHIGDVLKLYDNLHGWKWYVIENAVPFVLLFGKYMMWQITAKKNDMEGYIDLEKAPELNSKNNAINHNNAYTNDGNNLIPDTPPAPKPRPRIY
jgi:hypothetical protein